MENGNGNDHGLQLIKLRVFEPSIKPIKPTRPSGRPSINPKKTSITTPPLREKKMLGVCDVGMAWHGMPLAENIPSRLVSTKGDAGCAESARGQPNCQYTQSIARRVASTPTANRRNILNNKSSASPHPPPNPKQNSPERACNLIPSKKKPKN